MKLNYEIVGHGDNAIIVETALGSTFVEWRPILKHLSDKYLIFLYDRAGYGKSDESEFERSPKIIAQQLRELVSQIIPNKRYLFIGHSIGGLYVQQYIRDFKPNVIGAIFLDPATTREYDALFFRNTYTDKIDYVKQSISKNNYFLIDSTIQIQNYLDKTKPYKLRYGFTAKPEVVNNKIYISPFLQELITDNPLKQKERRYPIDMVYPKKRVYESTLSIPEGYQVDFIPKDLNINNELFELNYMTIGND